jgi:hypothetical protein
MLDEGSFHFDLSKDFKRKVSKRWNWASLNVRSHEKLPSTYFDTFKRMKRNKKILIFLQFDDCKQLFFSYFHNSQQTSSRLKNSKKIYSFGKVLSEWRFTFTWKQKLFFLFKSEKGFFFGKITLTRANETSWNSIQFSNFQPAE